MFSLKALGLFYLDILILFQDILFFVMKKLRNLNFNIQFCSVQNRENSLEKHWKSRKIKLIFLNWIKIGNFKLKFLGDAGNSSYFLGKIVEILKIQKASCCFVKARLFSEYFGKFRLNSSRFVKNSCSFDQQGFPKAPTPPTLLK